MPGAAPPLKSPLQTQLYQAGAGAGKTRKLTETIIEAAQKFKEDRGRFPRIVVTTFTRKATQELRERLMLKADEIGDPELTALLVSPSHVHISTIHGVLHTFLARYGHVFGIDPAFEVIDERDNRHLARRALKKVIFDNESYQELLEDFDINLLVHMLLGFYEASMGSEELRAITEDELREAMNEIKADVQAKLARVVARIESEVTDAKWAAFGQILKGIGFELTKADWSEGRAGLMSALNGLKKPTYRKDSTAVPAAVNEALEELMDDLKELKNAIYDPEVWPNFFETAAQFDPLAKAFVAEFRRLKRTEGVLSMGDLELVALRGIRIHPETARNFAAEWDFWLIDEFQDTSPLQNKILLELIGESAYFVVGDPQQSIYLFRGARSEVFQGQRQRIASLEGELHALTANYRSTPQIVHFFNEFFTALSPSFKPMEPKGEQRSKLEAPIVFFKANDAETEAAGIVNHVKSLLAGGAAPESICVLGRTNDVLVRLAGKLYEARVPVFVHSNSGFAERREVQDAVALLKFLANPHDNKNLIQLLRSPWYRVSDADLVSNLTGAPVSYWDQLREKQWPALTLLRALLGQSREVGLSHVFNEAIATHGLIDFSIHYDGSGRRESNIWKLAGRLKEAECEPDFNIVDFVAEYMADHAASEFSDEGDAVAALEPQRVNLMTVHRSKGLQFRHVIIPDMNRKPGTQGSVPFLVDEARQVWMLPVQIGEDSTRTHSHLGKLTLRRRRELEAEESDRVLYVAMTRAVESLFMSWSGVPKKDSWVQRMKWDLTTGRHQREHYLYEVRDRIDEVSNYVPLVQKASVPRTPYKSALEVRRTQSVTELLKSQEFGDNSLARSQARLKKSLDGVLIHELFEAMRYTRELPLEVLRTRFGERAEHIQRAIEFVRGLREVPMGELLKSGHAEWGFLLSEKGHNLPGRIDLWGESGGTAWIIDYKTGDPDRTPSAFDQLSIYSLALRRFGVKAPIKLAVIYPLSEYVSVRPAPEEQWVLERFFVAIKKGTSG